MTVLFLNLKGRVWAGPTIIDLVLVCLILLWDTSAFFSIVIMTTMVLFSFFFTLVTGPRRSLRLQLINTRVYEPQIRATMVPSNLTRTVEHDPFIKSQLVKFGALCGANLVT